MKNDNFYQENYAERSELCIFNLKYLNVLLEDSRTLSALVFNAICVLVEE